MIKAYRSYYFKAMSYADWRRPNLFSFMAFLLQIRIGWRCRDTYAWKGREIGGKKCRTTGLNLPEAVSERDKPSSKDMGMTRYIEGGQCTK